MAFKVAVYHKSVPNKKNLEKTQMLELVGASAGIAGDQVVGVQDYTPVECDVAVIQGWVASDINRPHLALRNAVINQQLNNNKYVLTADSNLFLYANTDNPMHYLRYSFNGVFPHTGIYFDTAVDPTRWQKISQDLNITVKKYRPIGNHILLCLQRDSGWSMGGYSVVDWVQTTIKKLRQHSNRPIVIRAHPGDRQSKIYLKELVSQQARLNFKFSHNADIKDDFQNCWAVVNHNSSPAVAASIEGIPVFVTDPERSQCREIANTDLRRIERPNLPDRTDWLNRLAMSHWKFDELKSGEAWAHMRQFVLDTPLDAVPTQI
jgi:hypothetical protein